MGNPLNRSRIIYICVTFPLIFSSWLKSLSPIKHSCLFICKYIYNQPTFHRISLQLRQEPFLESSICRRDSGSSYICRTDLFLFFLMTSYLSKWFYKEEMFDSVAVPWPDMTCELFKNCSAGDIFFKVHGRRGTLLTIAISRSSLYITSRQAPLCNQKFIAPLAMPWWC